MFSSVFRSHQAPGSKTWSDGSFCVCHRERCTSPRTHNIPRIYWQLIDRAYNNRLREFLEEYGSTSLESRDSLNREFKPQVSGYQPGRNFTSRSSGYCRGTQNHASYLQPTVPSSQRLQKNAWAHERRIQKRARRSEKPYETTGRVAEPGPERSRQKLSL